MSVLCNAMMMSGSVPFLSGLQLYLDASDSSTITKAYQNLAATGSGTSGTTVITAASTETGKVQAGMKLRIGGTDIYTVASVSTTTINTIETLTSNYVAQAMALDRVSQWNDKSGRGNNATQGTALTQPVYNPAILNSKAVLAFDGANTLALPSALYTLPTGASTIFCVAKRATASGAVEQMLNLAIVAAGTGREFLRFATTEQVDGLNNIAGTVVSQAATTTNFNIHRFRRLGTTQAVSVNNAAETSNTSATDEAGVDSAMIGSRLGNAQFLTGSIYMLLIYNRSLSATEMIQVEQWIAQQTGITIS